MFKLTTTDTSESAANARTTSRGKAVPGKVHEHRRPGDRIRDFTTLQSAVVRDCCKKGAILLMDRLEEINKF